MILKSASILEPFSNSTIIDYCLAKVCGLSHCQSWRKRLHENDTTTAGFCLLLEWRHVHKLQQITLSDLFHQQRQGRDPMVDRRSGERQKKAPSASQLKSTLRHNSQLVRTDSLDFVVAAMTMQVFLHYCRNVF